MSADAPQEIVRMDIIGMDYTKLYAATCAGPRVDGQSPPGRALPLDRNGRRKAGRHRPARFSTRDT